jgi:probable F420-dependent oxidoreductase
VTSPTPFRFALDLQQPLPGLNWVDSFKQAEQLGYSSVFFPDHFDEGPGPLAAMAAAAATTTLTVGTLVLDCDFRHPAILARELATIDHLSEGRLEVGIGAGWKSLDYRTSGIPMDRPGVRVDRMIEHLAVLKGCWSGEPFSFQGEHYNITELTGSPTPFRPGGPRILIGGGAPRVLRFAAEHADIVGINASIHSGVIDTDAALDATPTRIDEKAAWVREASGDRYERLEINAWLAVAQVTEDAMSFAEMVAPLFGTEPTVMMDSPLAVDR